MNLNAVMRDVSWPSLGAVVLIHGAVLAWVTLSSRDQVPDIVPPALVGELVTPADAPPLEAPRPAPPTPAPPKASPQPRKSVSQEPPLPKAPESEQAITRPEVPPEPVKPSKVTPAEPDVQPAPAPVKADKAEPTQAPVTPPRSDASHLNNPAPRYPSSARQRGEEGRVLLSVYILPDGSVGEIKLKKSSGHDSLDKAALAAVGRWRFMPATQGGVAIPYWYTQPIDFNLEK